MDDPIAPLDADIAEALSAEIEATRRKLTELTELAGRPHFARASKDPPRISVGITREEFNQLQNLARRCDTSVSALAQLAIRHLLIQSSTGAMPMLPTALTMKHAMNQPTVAELEEDRDRIQARINILDAQIELDRLAGLTESKTE